MKAHISDFGGFRSIFLAVMPYSVELSACIGIGGCGWPISIKVCCNMAACLVLIYSAPSSAFVVEDIIGLMIYAMLWTASLFGGMLYCQTRRNVPPLWCMLLACLNKMHHCALPLAWYITVASLFVIAYTVSGQSVINLQTANKF